jgi:type III pantothenate kinase
MLLAIDAGNTNIVFAVHDGTRMARPLAHRHARRPHLGRIRRLAARAVPACRGEARTTSRAASSAPWCRPRSTTSAACAATGSTLEPLIARAHLDWGFEIRVDQPNEVGADRLLNALASHTHYRGPLIVIDFGTATTFDVVDADGAYLGGVIAPGINLSIEALHRAAARLPRIGIGRPQAVIGRSTVPAMQSGIYWGYVGMIEGIVSRIQAEYGAPLKVIATGGLAPLFAEGTLVIETTDPDITLEGCACLAERNPVPVFHHSALRDPLRRSPTDRHGCRFRRPRLPPARRDRRDRHEPQRLPLRRQRCSRWIAASASAGDEFPEVDIMVPDPPGWPSGATAWSAS